MSDVTELRRRILSEPDDDGLRLVWADALTEAGDPRGEFVVAQVELAKAGIFHVQDLVRSPAAGDEFVRLAALLRRSMQLLYANRPRWCREDLGVEAAWWSDFRRGMVWSLDFYGADDPLRALHHAAANVPLGYLKIADEHASDAVADAVFSLPLGEIRVVDLGDTVWRGELARLFERVPKLERFEGPIAGEHAVAAFGRPMSHLRELRLKDADALAALHASPLASQITKLQASAGSLAKICDGTFSSLTSLSYDAGVQVDLRGERLPAKLQPHRLAPLLELPGLATVRELVLSVVPDEIEALASASSLGAIEVALHADILEPLDFARLANARTKLVTLSTRQQANPTIDDLAAFVARHPLRELDLKFDGTTRRGLAATAVVGALGPAAQLRSLELQHLSLRDKHVAALGASPAGKALRHFDCYYNEVGYHGAVSLARDFPMLVSLNTQSNRIDTDGYLELATTPNLTFLYTDTEEPAYAALAARLGAIAGDFGRYPRRVAEAPEGDRRLATLASRYVLFPAKQKLAKPALRTFLAEQGVEVTSVFKQHLGLRDASIATPPTTVAPDLAASVVVTLVQSREQMIMYYARNASGDGRIATFQGSLRFAYRDAQRDALAPLLERLTSAAASWLHGVIYDAQLGEVIATSKREPKKQPAAKKKRSAAKKKKPATTAKRKR